MADEFDGCECVWSHEFAMQRLLAFIRQSQNHCTDTECIDINGRLPQQMTPTGGNEVDNFTMMTVFMLLAAFMYFIRPASFMKSRRLRKENPNNDSGPPPPPPAPPAVN